MEYPKHSLHSCFWNFTNLVKSHFNSQAHIFCVGHRPMATWHVSSLPATEYQKQFGWSVFWNVASLAAGHENYKVSQISFGVAPRRPFHVSSCCFLLRHKHFSKWVGSFASRTIAHANEQAWTLSFVVCTVRFVFVPSWLAKGAFLKYVLGENCCWFGKDTWKPSGWKQWES